MFFSESFLTLDPLNQLEFITQLLNMQNISPEDKKILKADQIKKNI
jgi:hypothetical protein